MTNFTKSEENYIAHEVTLRIHNEKIRNVRDDIRGIKRLLFSILGIGITSIIVPIVLHAYKLA